MRGRQNTATKEMRLGDRTLAVLEQGQKHENKYTIYAKKVFDTPPYSMKGLSYGSTQKEKSGKE